MLFFNNKINNLIKGLSIKVLILSNSSLKRYREKYIIFIKFSNNLYIS